MAADILIVDDEADIRELVAGILEDEGYRCARLAQDSDAALADGRAAPALAHHPRHLAAGRRLDGLELLDLVKERDPTCR